MCIFSKKPLIVRSFIIQPLPFALCYAKQILALRENFLANYNISLKWVSSIYLQNLKSLMVWQKNNLLQLGKSYTILDA
jgi:hypothetical protein